MVNIIKTGQLDWITEFCNCGRCQKSNIKCEITGCRALEINNQTKVCDVLFICKNKNAKYSSLFKYQYHTIRESFINIEQGPVYYTQTPILKLYDLRGITTFKNYTLLTTSFKNCKEGQNTILYWSNINKIRYLNIDDKITAYYDDSRTIRDELIKCIMLNTGYGVITNLTVSGIETIGNLLLFSINQIETKDCSKDVSLIISVKLFKNNDELKVDQKTFKIEFNYNVKQYIIGQSIEHKKAFDLKLNQICFDKLNNQLYLSTSYQNCKDIGGFILKLKWYSTLQKFSFNIDAIRQTTPIENCCDCECETECECTKYYRPENFCNEPNGLSIINNNLLICYSKKHNKNNFKYDIITI